MLKPKETKEISDLFKRLDKDETGYISTEELTNSLKLSKPGMTMLDAKSIVKELDFAGNSKINYSEFLSAWINLKEVLKDDDRTKALYNQFDYDGSGRLIEENIIESLGVMGKDISSGEMQSFFKMYGEPDGSGVTFDSFKDFLMNG